jgi:hypothetical protein
MRFSDGSIPNNEKNYKNTNHTSQKQENCIEAARQNWKAPLKIQKIPNPLKPDKD